MGMSASQARLIALTARMSDTEYEAQQINQQRLTLSNQMNAVYEAMCNMEVPTPPSKLDPQYKKQVYTNKAGNQKLKVNDNGTVSRYNAVKNGPTVQSAGQQTVSNIKDPKDCVEPQEYSYADIQRWEIAEDTPKLYSGTIKYKEGTFDRNTGKFVITDDAPEKELPISDQADTDFNIPQGAVITTNDTHVSKYLVNGQYRTPEDITAHNTKLNEFVGKEFARLNADGSYSLVNGDAKEGDKLYVISNLNDFNNAVQAKAEGKKTGLTVGGGRVVAMNEALAKYEGIDAFTKALDGLKNKFSENYEWKDKFSVLVFGNDKDGYTFKFAKSEDINGKTAGNDNLATVWEFTTGPYDQYAGEVAVSDIVYDDNGNIKSVGDESYTLDSEFNEDLFDEDMAKYNSDKAVYDQEQNRLNKQTSIYQRQDKMLELKLTRLDNERNALNTEIEAVKKVIQDSIDRGFKTFSG